MLWGIRMRSQDTVSSLELELLFNYLKESYEADNFVSDESLNSIVRGITHLHKRHYLQNIFNTLGQEHRYFFKYQNNRIGRKGYQPIHDNSKKQKLSKLSSRLLLIHLRKSYESGSFVSYESLNSIVPGITSRKMHYRLNLVLDILNRENGYFFKYQHSPEKGYKPVAQKINYSASLVIHFKKAYESNTFISYQDIDLMISDSVSTRESHVKYALVMLKNQYGYIFQNVFGKGYFPITDINKRFCKRCEEILPITCFQKKESDRFTITDANFFGSCKNCHKEQTRQYHRQYQRNRRERVKEAIAST